MSEASIVPGQSSVNVDLTGRSALVTGSASGIGRACAERLSRAGAAVTVLDLDGDTAREVAESIGGEAIRADLSDYEVLGSLEIDTDIVVNNAGLQHVAAVEEFPPERFSMILRIMLEAPFRIVQKALPGMYERGWGRVINISSIHGMVASPYKSAYISAKHGLEGFSKTVALEGGTRGVTSNCLCPAYVRTPLVENQISDQASTHGISEDEVVEKIMLTEPAIKRLIEPAEGTPLWEPSEQLKEKARISNYMDWLKDEKDLSFSDYNELWEWSVGDLDGFWASIWEYCGIKASKPYERVLGKREMPGAEWFPGAELNYAEHVLRHTTDRQDEPAILHQSELRSLGEVSWGELQEKTATLAAGLRELGVERGDRVAVYLPNVPEAVIALLACASIGAVWSSCSPDFGAGSVVDRFKQIEPKILIAVDGYRYGGKDYDRIDVVARLQQEIPTLQKTVVLPYLSEDPDTGPLEDVVMWDELLAGHKGAEISFEQVPFDHPLWVLYSSGTTGLPKAIVHSQGGILIEHLKKAVLHLDLEPDDRFFWFTTTGWMMWNLVVAGLLTGSTILLYDGNPGHPDMNVLWEFAEKTGVTCFGTSATCSTACIKADIEPGKDFDLASLKSIGSTGSPLPPEGFEWAYEHVKEDLWLFSTSGGTDMCTAFVGGVPLLPVRAGELQARSLGAKVEAFDEEGNPQVDDVGELVITEPMPSMPIYFWNDPEGERYRESYFDVYPGVWRHGDWIKVKENGACVIYGRSDSTINRGGIRMGTSEIYSAVDKVEEVADSLVVDVPREGGSSFMPLFVVLQEGVELDDDLKYKIKRSIKDNASPRHVPNEIFAVSDIPRTLNGKKLEVPVKKILSGTPPEEAASKESLSNPETLDRFAELAGNM